MQATNKSVLSIGRGLYLGQSPLSMPEGALEDGRNFRVKEGRLENLNLGWSRFGSFQLNGPVRLIDNFFPRGQDELLIFGTLTDLYLYDTGGGTVTFLTPRYEEGTAAASGTAVTGTGTTWLTNVADGDQISFGSTGITDPAATWFEIANVSADDGITLTATAGTVVDGPYTIRKVFHARLLDFWDTETFVRPAGGDDLWFCTNGVDPIVTWDGQATQVTQQLFSPPFTCRTLVNYANMMIYGNVEQAGELLPTTIINSVPGDPLDVSGGLASQFVVHGGTDEILNLVPMSDFLLIYSSRRLVLAQFVGSPLIFTFRPVITGLGPLGPGTIADFGDFQIFVGSDSQYEFDGATISEVNTHVWREAIRTQDSIKANMAFSHFDEENGDLIWCFPRTTDSGAGDVDLGADTAYAEHYLEEVGDQDPTPYSFRDFPFTASGYYEQADGRTWDSIAETWAQFNYRWNDRFFAAAFPLNLAGDINGFIYQLSASQNGMAADGATEQALDTYVRFARRALADGVSRGLLARIYPFAHQLTSALDVIVRLYDSAAGQLMASQAFSFDQTLPEEGHFVSVYRRARFGSIQFGTFGLNLPWLLDGYSFDIKQGGRR